MSNALFKFWNHYQAVLPYNLNWQIKLGPDEERFLSQNPLIVCDVGARGSAPEELAPFYAHMVYHAFDADKDECDRLNSLASPYHEFCAFPYYIGKDAQQMVFNIFKQAGEILPTSLEKDLRIYSEEIASPLNEN